MEEWAANQRENARILFVFIREIRGYALRRKS
ncbi:MAG: hypothetical protein JWM08_2431 [Candidatus Angelobacter sp.]|nr:hypothetical protein [Candidatus Angelobacter sp.]